MKKPNATAFGFFLIFKNIMENTKEHIQVLTVLAGENGDEVVFKPEAGKIIGCMAFPLNQDDLKNTDFVNVSLQDSAGVFLSKPQDIRNYRSRDAKYSEGCKPLKVEGGNQMTLRVQSKSAFTADFSFQFILVYENQKEDTNCNF